MTMMTTTIELRPLLRVVARDYVLLSPRVDAGRAPRRAQRRLDQVGRAGRARRSRRAVRARRRAPAASPLAIAASIGSRVPGVVAAAPAIASSRSRAIALSRGRDRRRCQGRCDSTAARRLAARGVVSAERALSAQAVDVLVDGVAADADVVWRSSSPPCPRPSRSRTSCWRLVLREVSWGRRAWRELYRSCNLAASGGLVAHRGRANVSRTTTHSQQERATPARPRAAAATPSSRPAAVAAEASARAQHAVARHDERNRVVAQAVPAARKARGLPARAATSP